MTAAHLLNTLLSDVLAERPAAARVFIDRRMGCVGCAFAPFETVGEAARAYGIEPGELAHALADGCGAVRTPEENDPMTITETTTVAEIAAALPSSVRVFQRHGIDFCCGGKTPLAVACEEQGIPFVEIARAIQATAAGPAAGERDWTREPLPALIDHIVGTYHDSLREELPRLESMAARVACVHGAKGPRLVRLEATVTQLAADLRAHMRKEEMVLFPAIRALEPRPEGSNWISQPIAVMEHEHDHAGALLSEIRALTDGYTTPEWACETFRALYHGLAELESTMHVHVHLENNVLFPRAQASIVDE